MIGKHKRIVCIMIMIMLLFSQGFPTFASQGTGSVTDVVVETGNGLVVVSIGAYAIALADGPGNETYDYMAGEGVPLVSAIGSGDKFINISEYAIALADTGNVPDAIAAATALGREHTSTFKVLKGFNEDGKPILEPLFTDIVYASTVETDFDITVSLGTSEEELVSRLRATVDVLGSNDERATATINWTLEEGYDGYVEGTYLATGVLTLPEGWNGNPDNVKATVTVLPQEHLVLWLDAADYNASTGVWPDKSGFNNTVSQADAAKRPSRANPEELAGRPAVRFNGDDQYLDLQWNMDGGSFKANEITVFMVLKSYNMEDSQTVMGNYGEEGDVCFHISTRQNVLTAAVTHSDDEGIRLTFSDSLEPIIASYRVTPTEHTAYVNGSRTSTGSLSESIDWGASTIGRNGGTLSENIREWHWEGYIAEIRIYDCAMDDGEREAVEKELSGKWFPPKPLTAVHFAPTSGLREGTSNVAVGATVGTLSASGGSGSISYFLVAGDGDSHNNRFEIEGNKVKVKGEALSEGTYSFRVKAVDSGGNEKAESFTITVRAETQQTPDGLVLWLDAADYNASTGVWPDKSGFNNTVSQASSNNRPSRANPEELDGRPAVSFNGGNQYLDLKWNMDGGSLKTDEITVFMVLKSDNMNDSQTVMGNYGEEGSVFFHVSTNQKQLTASVSSRDNRINLSDSLEPIIAAYKVTPTNHTAYVNGTEAATGSLNETINWGTSSIGRNGGPLGSNIEEWHWEGYIAEIRIYNYAMDDWERNDVEQELERKWFSPINPEPIAAVHFMPFPRLWAGSSNVAPGATVGIMSARGGIGSVNYSFVEGEGDTHNNRFTIVGNEVRVGDTALSQGIYSFRVRGQDDVAQTEYYFSIAILENLESSDVTILTNPYSEVDWETFNQYKANFHTHTNQSDGGAGPAAVIEAYADAGYSILALTDHDSNNPDTTWPWTKWISQGPVLINYRSDEKHEDYETSALYTDLGSTGDKTILAVRGNELSSTHHTSSLFSEYGGPRSGEEYKAIQEIRDRGGLAILNHPGRPGFTENRADEWYADIYTEYQGTLIGMEVHNQGDRYPGDRERWDRVNAMLMPDIVVWGYSNDDMHQIDTHTFRNYQFMLMEELTEEALRNAMLSGASYFCYEPREGLSGVEFAGDHQVPLIEEIVVNDTSEVTIIKIDVHGENTADTITWRTDKREIQGMGNAIDLNELDLDEDIFIRAELENNYGRTYTQPFVLGYEPLEEIPVTGVGIVEEDQVLEVGDTQQLTAVIAPANATEKGVSWSSANEEVASVSGSGLVTALSGGTALITVTTVDGRFTDYVTITVKGPDQPEPMEGLVLWLDASAVESLEHGETVETWNDLSGKGNDAVQAADDKRPSYGTGYNGRPAIHFDGNDDCLDLDWEGSGGALKPDSNSMTIFIVLSHNDFMGDSQTIMGNMSTEGDVWIHKSGSEDRTYAVVNGNRNDADRLVYFGEPEDNPDFHVLTWQYDHDADTGKHRSYVNGVHIDSASEAVTIDLGPMSIGRNRLDEENQWHWKGYIAEIRIYDRALEDAERQAVENELRDKWFSEPPPKPISAIHFTAVTGLREGTGSVAAGATVGTLSATDGIGNITYSLVAGEDDSDSFTIEGNEVKVASAALTAGTYNFRVKGEDEEGHEVVASFTVTVFEKTEFPLDGLVLHLNAADYNQESGEWPDRSNINNIVFQNEPGSRPTKHNDGFNGLPVVRFNGTDQYLNLNWGDALGDSLETDGITIILVMKDGGKTGNTQVIIGNYRAENQLAISKSSQSPYAIVARIYGSSSYNFDSCEFTTETGPYVLTFDYDNETMRTFVDGEAANRQSSSRAVKWADTAIGCSGTGSANYWSGDIAEIIIYNRVLTDEERAFFH